MVVISLHDEFDGIVYLTENNELSPDIRDAKIFKTYDDAERYIENSDNETVCNISYHCDISEILKLK